MSDATDSKRYTLPFGTIRMQRDGERPMVTAVRAVRPTVTAVSDTDDDRRIAVTQQDNPFVAIYARRAGIAMEDVREHGPKRFVVLDNLRELADASLKRP